MNYRKQPQCALTSESTNVKVRKVCHGKWLYSFPKLPSQKSCNTMYPRNTVWFRHKIVKIACIKVITIHYVVTIIIIIIIIISWRKVLRVHNPER